MSLCVGWYSIIITTCHCVLVVGWYSIIVETDPSIIIQRTAVKASVCVVCIICPYVSVGADGGGRAN